MTVDKDVKVIYEDLATNRWYTKNGKGYQEIDVLDEKHYRGLPISHGYMYQITMEHCLWVNRINEKPTIEDKLTEVEKCKEE